MLRNKRLLIVGVTTLLIGFIVQFPARVGYHAFFPDSVRLAGISGSVWRGQASEGEIGQLYVSDIRWSVRPLALLTGRLALDLSLNPAGGFVETQASVSALGNVRLTNAQGGVTIAALQNLIPMPGIEGNLRLDLAELAISDGLPTSATGTIDVFGLVARGLSPTPIGDFRAQLASTDGAVSGSLEDLSGVLDIAGSLRISADRSYVIEGLVAPRPAAAQSIVSQLQFLGSPNERGQRQFRLEGRL